MLRTPESKGLLNTAISNAANACAGYVERHVVVQLRKFTDKVRSIVPAVRANRLHVNLPLRLLHDRIFPHDR